MQIVSTDRMDEMESRCGTDVDVLLCRITSLADVCKMTEQIEYLAGRHGFPSGEFSSFVRAKAFANIWKPGTRRTPRLHIMAQQLGLCCEEFHKWIRKVKRQKIRAAERYDYIQDLQQDAGDAMDGE